MPRSLRERPPEAEGSGVKAEIVDADAIAIGELYAEAKRGIVGSVENLRLCGEGGSQENNAATRAMASLAQNKYGGARV